MRPRSLGLIAVFVLLFAGAAVVSASLTSQESGKDPATMTPIQRIATGAGVETVGPAECVVGTSCAVVIVDPPQGSGTTAQDATLTAAVRPTLREVVREFPKTVHVQITVVARSGDPRSTTLRITCQDDAGLGTVDWNAETAASLRRRCDVTGL